MENDQELAKESGLIESIDDPMPDIKVSILKEIKLLRGYLNAIKVTLFILAAIVIYVVLFK